MKIISRRKPEADSGADIGADAAETQLPEEPGVPAQEKKDEKPKYDPIKVSLVNTEPRAKTLLRRLAAHEGFIGFDTEFVGVGLRGQDFTNISHAALLGVSISLEGKTAKTHRNYYVPIRHKGNNIPFAWLDKVMAALAKAAAQGRLWMHNAKIDHQAVALDGYKLEGALDTMIAAWLVTGRNKGIDLKGLAKEIFDRNCPPYDPSIGSKTGDQVKFYAGHDSRNTLDLALHYWTQLGTLYQQKDLTPWLREECTFTHTLADMKTLGMRIDCERLLGLGEVVREEQARILAEWYELAGDIKISSATQLQKLFVEGIWVENGMTKGGAFSTAGSVMEYNLDHGRGDGKRLAQLRLDYQEVAKIVSTYSDELVEEARQWRDGKLHPNLWHFGTVTGRLSSSGPNIQNQPARGDYAKYVRECFIPDPGKEFTSADYSQVELRYFAEYCGGGLLQMFLDGTDVHQRTADAMGCTRAQAKIVNFGFLLYGGAPEKLGKEVLNCSKAEAEEKVAALHAEYPEVEAWRARIIQQADDSSPSTPFVHTLAGRIRYIPQLNPEYCQQYWPEVYAAQVKKYHDRCRQYGRKPSARGEVYSVRSAGERLLVNYLIQGGARDLLVLGINYYRRNAPEGFEPVTTVHDEVLTQHPKGAGEEGRALLKESLESAGPALGLTVPIVAEPLTGENWYVVK